MGKAPAIQFYVKDWLSDSNLQMCSHSTRGIWIDLLCYMWISENKGIISGTYDEIKRMLGATTNDFDFFLTEADRHNFCDKQEYNSEITLINRRMSREQESKVGNRERQKKYRDKGGGNPQKWMAIRLKILERDGSMCAYCGRKADTVDHIIPKTRGGNEDESNLVACCKRCNQSKNNRTPKEADMDFWKGFDKDKIEYNSKITPPSPSPSPSPTIKSTPEASPQALSKDKKSRHWEDNIDISDLLNKIKKARDELANDYQIKKVNLWIQQKVNTNGHPKAILLCLERTLKELRGNADIRNWYGYAEKIFQVENGNFNERESIEMHEKIKNMSIDDTDIKKLCRGIGGAV